MSLTALFSVKVKAKRDSIDEIGETYMLSMENVFYSYRKKRANHDVLNGISMSFSPGKIYALYGSSGSGKTTCLSLLGGLDSPNKGTIALDGTDIKAIGYSNLRRNHVSYIFQDYHLFSYLTAVENVLLAAAISKIPLVSPKDTAVKILRDLGIDNETMNRQVSKTSGGQQQRIAIARALINNPMYILADEPTGNLDKNNSLNIIELLSNLAHKQNKCVIIATHADVVIDYADVIIHLDNGQFYLETDL